MPPSTEASRTRRAHGHPGPDDVADRRHDHSALFNRVFFDDMRLPVEPNGRRHGWRRQVTLANERVSLSSAGSLWGAGPSAYDLLEQIKGMGPVVDPTMRQKVARMFANGKCWLGRLTLSAKLNDEHQVPGIDPEAHGR